MEATRRLARKLARRSLLLLAATTPELAAQAKATLVGIVRDTSGAGVSLVRISVGDARTVSDSAGRFALDGLPSGPATVVIRRLGFTPLDARVELAAGRTDSVSLVLAALPGQLPGIAADADALERVRLAEFYRHREVGNGFFFNRRELDSIRVVRISDVLRRLPGMRLIPDRSGRLSLRTSRSSNCTPDFWIDGQRAQFLNVDDLPLRDVQALEVYRGSSEIPPEYNSSRMGSPSCGAVVIWTRLPG